MTTQTMIERVADAIASELGDAVPIYNNLSNREAILDGEADLKAVARAALQALREPTEEMVAAAGETTHSPSMKAMWPKIVRDLWCLMIDAALQEKT